MKAFRLRVLIDYKEDVFRDVLLREDQTFFELHLTIQEAFEFDGQQIASFYLSNDDWDRGEEIAQMDFDEDFGPSKLKTMEDTKLGDLIQEKGQKLLYVYDFMLMWCFYVELLDISEATDEEYPLLATEYGKSPDQYSKESPVLSDEEAARLLTGSDDDDDEDLDSEIGGIFDEYAND